MRYYRFWSIKIVLLALVALSGLVIAGCVLPSTPPAIPRLAPATNNPIVGSLATTTQLSVLPIMVVPEAGASPTRAPIASPTQLPTSTIIPPQLSTSTPPPDITLLFTGVIVPARCVQSAIDARDDATYVYDEVRDLISGADLAVGTLNTTFSDLSEHTGCVFTYVLVSDSRSAVAASEAGFDVMSVATNHIMNCSGASCTNNYNQAFFDTLDNLRANNIRPVGAGMDLAEAMQPVVVEVQGVRFGIVSLGMVDAMRYATESGQGIARLNNENLQQAIANARQVADVVIAMPHWGPEDVSDPNSYQLHYAEAAVQAGADVVVGNHTHVVQAIQQINGVDVFYGLGNFVFDQNWDLAHQQAVILLLHFSGAQYTGYQLIPTHVDGDGTVHLAGKDEAAEIIQRIQDASDRLR